VSGKVGFVSLGCPKALVDSERILTELRSAGYELVPSYEQAEVVVVNTCGFITPAVEESLDAIGEAIERSGKVVVTGCLGEKPETILERHPQVAAVTGESDVDGVMKAVGAILPPDDHPFVRLTPSPRGVKLTPRHYAYLKIAEGCNHTCSFCIIPHMRGLQRSRDAADILGEATRLVATGTRELVVIAQDTSAYGVDLRYRESRFADRDLPARLVPLVRELADLDVWVRLHYVYPYPHVRELMPLMAEGRLLPYLDVPLQHASPKVLRAMRRPGGAESHLDTLRAWREVVPDLAIRSTFITGFPGETEEDVELLIDFLREARLDRVGVFAYSEVEGAAANALPGAVPPELREERRARVMEAQQRVSAEVQAAKVGRELDVIIDAYGDLPGEIVGRSVYDAPDVDGTVTAASDGTVKIGDRVVVRIEAADAYDLRGAVVAAKPWSPAVPSWGG
jgi:ribosomal protein S12 methylthiotransferase